MKNLYKIEDELYIISNTENISENCWIITDGRLVQVSYLLSDEVAKGNKVILTTNKLLIKDGLQEIDDEFLEWFSSKNPSCDSIKINLVPVNEYGSEITVGGYGFDRFKYKIIIPQEESKQSKIDLDELEFKLDTTLSKRNKKKVLTNWLNSKRDKKENIEEAATQYVNANESRARSFGMVYSAFCNGAKHQQELDKNLYSEEEVFKLLNTFNTHTLTLQLFKLGNSLDVKDWFEEYKKK